jgi:outer membrane protein assembly factor BamA
MSACALAGGIARGEEPTIHLENYLESVNFRDLPFILIPVVGTDPDTGTVLGLMPVFLKTDEQREIREIIAPDVIRDPNFGYGTRGRIFSYPSEDTQWSVVGGIRQRVERNFSADYTTGLTRRDDWSLSVQAVYDRDGTGRFYGIGNQSSVRNATNYLNEVAYLEGRIGWNANHDLQFAYTLRPRFVDIGAGVLDSVPSIQTRFPVEGQLGARHEFLNLFSITYDTRDSLNIPTHGLELVFYAGFSEGIFGDAMAYSVAGIDVRHFWPVAENLIIASHAALRYMPTDRNAPFWALSSLGSDRSVLAGQQPLRDFGANRFIDRNSFSASLELRYRVLDLQLFATNVSVELAPFVETGRVFHNLGDDPLASLHNLVGLGFRAVARPSVVGYVDVGYGSEGAAVFSGISYPF